LTGYLIGDGRIEPLDYSPGVVGFERYSGANANAFIEEIRSSLVSQSELIRTMQTSTFAIPTLY